MDKYWLNEGQKSFARLQPKLNTRFAQTSDAEKSAFLERLPTQLPIILQTLYPLYGQRYDFFYHIEQITEMAAEYFIERSNSLKTLDAKRSNNPNWFQSEQMVGGVCYIDRFAGDLGGLLDKLDYFEELGLTYLHLMPLFLCPEDNSDGGYAISDYRQVNPALGTMDDLKEVAVALGERGISLVVDFVFNHTSDEHQWAQQALAGDPDYHEFYYFFPDRTQPNAYENNLREIFPEQAPDNFTYLSQRDEWVWTTFNHFQWDLNYSNPDVFRAMLGELLFLANIGVDVFRLDAVAFTWKQMGTNCENLPEAHLLIQAFYAVMQIVAPAVIFKSEAIVHPDDVVRYFGVGEQAGRECQISYNPMLMVLLWDALATRKVDLMNYALAKRHQIPENCAWVNYVRCHDDIGWGFANEDAAILGINGHDHRNFLNAFYTGQFEGSFAKGLPFNYNPKTGDMRISGMAASLAGLEQALVAQDDIQIEHSIRRHLLIHSIILSMGGIPLIYLNDEIGKLNDYSYADNPHLAQDNRWVHRPATDWAQMSRRQMVNTIENRIFSQMLHMIDQRKKLPVLANGQMELINTHNNHVLGYLRGAATNKQVLILANFSEHIQPIVTNSLRKNGFEANAHDLIQSRPLDLRPESLILEPYQYLWIEND